MKIQTIILAVTVSYFTYDFIVNFAAEMATKIAII